MADEENSTVEVDEYDLVDALIDDLNDGVTDVTFERDVLETNRPEDWAAVELTGQDEAEWADGILIDQSLVIDIWVCVSDRGSGIKRKVQTVLKAFCAAWQTGWRMVSRNYIYDLDKVIWRWQVSIEGPLTYPEEEEEELPFTDPEEDPEETEDDPEWPEMDPGEGE